MTWMLPACAATPEGQVEWGPWHLPEEQEIPFMELETIRLGYATRQEMLDMVPTIFDWTEYTVLSQGTSQQRSFSASPGGDFRDSRAPSHSPHRLPSPQYLLDNMSAATLLDFAAQRMAMEKAQLEARMF